MSSIVGIKRTDTTLEKRILTGLIVSTRFLQEVQHIIQLAYFQNSFIRKVAEWCLQFYHNYETAPFDHIQDIFNSRKHMLKEEEVELVATLLTNISTRYELDSGLNVDYLVDQALGFFKRRELEIVNNNVGILLDGNDVDGAEGEITKFNRISRMVSGWINACDPKYIAEVFEKEDRMLLFPGQLGRFLGGFDRGWLVGVTAPFKRGKTWMLQEFAVLGLQQRLKVAFFSLEMHQKHSNERLYKRLLGIGDPNGGVSIYPVFDCLENQMGACDKPERVCRVQVTKDGGGKISFAAATAAGYKPCTYCRERELEYHKYIAETWWERIERPAFNEGVVTKQMKALRKMLGDRYRFKVYPRYSANTSDLKRDLDILERTDEFTPDIIIVDYADILAPEVTSTGNKIDDIDVTWKSLARLAGERHALVITAGQATRDSLDKKKLKQKDTAQWIGKLAHVDAMLTMNQTPDDKRSGVMRIGMMVHRYDPYDEDQMCAILQKLEFGQFNLDSQIV